MQGLVQEVCQRADSVSVVFQALVNKVVTR